MLEGAARAVVAAVADRRATHGRRNLLAEARRLLHGGRFASPADRGRRWVVDVGLALIAAARQVGYRATRRLAGPGLPAYSGSPQRLSGHGVNSSALAVTLILGLTWLLLCV